MNTNIIQYEKKVRIIEKWYLDYLNEEFKCMFDLGHTFMCHTNLDKKRLVERSLRKRIGCSTFEGDSFDIFNLIIRTLSSNKEEICEWLADPTDQDDWEVDFPLNDKVKGISYNLEKDCFEDAYQGVMFLVKDKNVFHVKTAYPR